MFGVKTITCCAICGGPIIVVSFFAICSNCMVFVNPDSGEPYNIDTSNEVADDFDEIEDSPPIGEFYNR